MASCEYYIFAALKKSTYMHEQKDQMIHLWFLSGFL